jgi:ABC-2 type transport system ATP-binding protein
MLKINNLSKTYSKQKKHALDDVSFEISKGEFTALLGPNGAGKSTLIQIIAGIVDRDSGSLFISGQDIDSGNIRLKTDIGIVPQEVTFDFHFNVLESLKLQSGYYGVTDNDEHIDYLLERLSLQSKRNEPVRNLSGGMKRRLLIAKALVHKPKILILDEPTAGVDISLRHDLYRFVQELNDNGMTIILTTHYLEEAENLCSRIILLNNGQVIADKSKTDFLRLAGDFNSVMVETIPGTEIGKHISYRIIPDEKENINRIEVPKTESGKLIKELSSFSDSITGIEINSPGLEDLFVRLTKSSGGEYVEQI